MRMKKGTPNRMNRGIFYSIDLSKKTFFTIITLGCYGMRQVSVSQDFINIINNDTVDNSPLKFKRASDDAEFSQFVYRVFVKGVSFSEAQGWGLRLPSVLFSKRKTPLSPDFELSKTRPISGTSLGRAGRKSPSDTWIADVIAGKTPGPSCSRCKII